MQAGLGIKLARLAIVVAIFALWELVSRSGIVNPRLLPSASDTLSTLGDLLQRASVRVTSMQNSLCSSEFEKYGLARTREMNIEAIDVRAIGFARGDQR